MKNLQSQIEKIAKENKDGFTIRINDLSNVTTGFMVAMEATQNCFGKKGLAKVIEIASQTSGIVGGWYFDNKYYFDASYNVSDLNEAIRIGKENNQIAIFDLDNLKEIKL